MASCWIASSAGAMTMPLRCWCKGMGRWSWVFAGVFFTTKPMLKTASRRRFLFWCEGRLPCGGAPWWAIGSMA